MKVVEGCYEIPMPLKCEIIDKLPNNCVGAVRRTESLRRSALKNVEMKLVNSYVSGNDNGRMDTPLGRN